MTKKTTKKAKNFDLDAAIKKEFNDYLSDSYIAEDIVDNILGSDAFRKDIKARVLKEIKSARKSK